jgi:diacylglycerol kinase (ATP)
VGGDGTVNEVARGLVHKGMPMGILPKGSGNGFARHLGISMDLSLALRQLLSGKIIASDTFLVNGKLSINVSGVGFDGHIANLFGQVNQRGLWGYAKLVLREYVRYPQFSIDIKTGETSKRYEAFIVAIANASQYGNNARVAPMAKVSDHLLQSIFLKKVPLIKSLSFAFNLFLGRLRNNSNYYCGTIQHAVFKTTLPVAYHVDGEPCGFAQEFKIELLAGSLSVVVPKESPNNI